MRTGGGSGVGAIGAGVGGGGGIGVGKTKILRPVPLLELLTVVIDAMSSGWEMIGSGVPPARVNGRGDGDGPTPLTSVGLIEFFPGAEFGSSPPVKN